MRIVAIAFGISNADKEMIDRMGSNILNREIVSFDLRVIEPDIEILDHVLAFGKKAALFIKTKKCSSVTLLPELSNLRPEPENERRRESVLSELNKIGKILDNNVPLTRDSVDILTRVDIVNLVDSIRKKRPISWSGTLMDGRTFSVTSGDVLASNTDLVLTVEEVLTLSALAGILDVKEIFIDANTTASDGYN